MVKTTVVYQCKPDQCPNFANTYAKARYGVSLDEFAESIEKRLNAKECEN
jgi:hypothetical protein